MSYIAIVDYGAGNLMSVHNTLDYLGYENKIAASADVIENAAGVILPGVGAFPDAMAALTDSGLTEAVLKAAKEKPFLGICLGMQMLLESSEEQMAPAKYKKALEYLKDAGVFAAVSGVLVGRPMDGVWQAEYEQLLRQVIDDPALPVVCGLNVGHALPRCIVPLGVPARVDVQAQKIEFL